MAAATSAAQQIAQAANTQTRQHRNGAARSGLQHQTGDAHSGRWRIDGSNPGIRSTARASGRANRQAVAHGLFLCKPLAKLGCCGQTGRYLLGLTVTRAVGRYERENCQMVQRPAFIRAAALKQFDFSAYFIDSLAQRDQRVPLFAGPIRSARLQKLNHNRLSRQCWLPVSLIWILAH